MRPVRGSELPPPRRPAYRRAVVLQWVSLGYQLSVIVLMYLVMGSSQAMRAAWLEDVITLAPPAAFLVSCDLLARTLLAPVELPVGIITALIGGPFFLWLLIRHR